jgi:hypothetical protein
MRTTKQREERARARVTSMHDRIRYRVDRFFQSGFTFQVFISFSLVIGIIVLYTILANALSIVPSKDFEVAAEDLVVGRDPFWPSPRFWWVLKHIFDTYWMERGFREQTFSLMLTLLNYLVFAGIVGLVGTKLAERIERIRRGTSRVVENDHIVILGWSDKVLPIIGNLIAGLDLKRTALAVLCPRPMEDVESELRREFGKPKQVRWAIRTGSPSDLSDLGLLSLPTARTIIALQPESDGDGDTRVVKSIVTLAHALRKGQTRDTLPSIIAEIERPAMQAIARAAAGNLNLAIVHPSEYIAKVILQTARQRGLASFYDEVLAYSGSEFHIRRLPALEGRPWSEIAFALERGIPVGCVENGTVRLLPFAHDEKATLPQGAAVICLAEDASALDHAPVASAPYRAPQGRAMEAATPVRSLLLLGYDQKVHRILAETNQYARALGETFAIRAASPRYAAHPLGDGDDPSHLEYEHLTVDVVARDPLVPGVIESLEPDTFDAVLILGEHTPGMMLDDVDTRSIMTLLLLRAAREKAGAAAAAQVVIEIQNHENREVAASISSEHDVIITNQLVSRMVAQLCREPHLDEVFRDLFNEEGAEVYFKPVQRYAASGDSASFGELMAAALGNGEMALGFDDSSLGTASLVLNPPKDARVPLRDDVRLCVLSEHEG